MRVIVLTVVCRSPYNVEVLRWGTPPTFDFVNGTVSDFVNGIVRGLKWGS